MQRDHRPHRLLVCGQSGMGKTTFLCRFLAGRAATCRFLFDPEGEFQIALKRPAVTVLDGAALAAAAVGGWCIFDPGRSDASSAWLFDWFSRVSFATAGRLPGRKIWCCDEVQSFCDTATPPGAAM
ncbi:MAG: hypothetical protein AAB368_11105, partial [bacterium]